MRTLEFNDEPSLLSTWHNITHLRQMNESASRFVPQEYLGFLHKESIININLGDYVSDEMTVMFSDLRSFTSISETMTPQENFDFVNAYLGRVSPVVREYHGFIVKYLGDGIMAIFPRCADDAVQAGIEKLNQVAVYNDYRRTKGRLPIQVGIGVNTGHMMVGMVGDRHRMQGDAFSDDVNLTSRLEGLTKYYHVSLIITAATYAQLADPSRYNIRFLDKVQVMGRQNALDLYEVYDADPPSMRALKQATQVDFEEALKLYYAQEFAEAQTKLFGVLQRNPKDKVAWQHLVQATQLAEQGVTEGWTGVTVMTKK
jgi:adenylate cyclase